MVSTNKLTEANSIAISYLRFTSTIFIVLCHYLQAFDNRWAWFFNIGVQLFFMISAFLFAQNNITNIYSWYKKRFLKIAPPYYVYFICISFFLYKYSAFFSWKNELYYMTITQGVFGGYNGLEHLWFLTYILVCYLLTPVLQRFCDKYQTVALPAIIGSFILGFISLRLTYVCLYSLVYCLSRKNNLKSIILPSIFLSIVLMLFFDFDKLADMRSLFSISFHIIVPIAIFSLTIFMSDFVRFPKMVCVNLLNKYSYEIYITHHFIIIGSFSLLSLTDNSSFNCVIVLILIIVQSVLLYFITHFIKRRLSTLTSCVRNG